MKAIVIVDKNWNIGKDGGLLVHLPSDLKYFKSKTEGNVIVIGRKTLQSFPNSKPLPNRTNIVLTNDKNFENENCIVCVGLDELNNELKKYDNDSIYISGGEMIYKLFLDRCDEVFVTKMENEFDADKSFRNLDNDESFYLNTSSEEFEENGVKFRFLSYKRV
ncbi:MAG: diacylglycerol kinase [Clostridiales bacterium]|nr:MAG: diacylglycerol kinase [Clostridiales bacterium]